MLSNISILAKVDFLNLLYHEPKPVLFHLEPANHWAVEVVKWTVTKIMLITSKYYKYINEDISIFLGYYS